MEIETLTAMMDDFSVTFSLSGPANSNIYAVSPAAITRALREDGYFTASRGYLTLELWDLSNHKFPMVCFWFGFPIHSLAAQLMDPIFKEP